MWPARSEGTGKSEKAVSRPDEVSRQDSQITPSCSPNRKTPPGPSAFSKQVGSWPSSSSSLTVTSPEGPAPMTATRLDTYSPPPTHRIPLAMKGQPSHCCVEEKQVVFCQSCL